MAEAASAAKAARLHLPDEIVIWEILVRLPPKHLLRCRTVCRSWRQVTSSRRFLLAHHDRQPNLPVISAGRKILAFDHQAAAATGDDQLRTVARLDDFLYPQASCDGLLVLARSQFVQTRFSICNPATREHALLGTASDLSIMGMYQHRPTGEYRLLLHRTTQKSWFLADLLPEGQSGCYLFVLGSNLPPRYVGWPETSPPCTFLDRPAMLHDKLYWYPSHCKAVIVFDTVAETFQQMHAPRVLRAPIAPSECHLMRAAVPPTSSYIFEIGSTLGIYNRDVRTEVIDIWLLQNNENEDWDKKYQIKLPVEEIRERFADYHGYCDVDLVSRDGGVLLLLSFGPWLIHIDTCGKLIDTFNLGDQGLRLNGLQLRQALIRHSFFTALEGYAVNSTPFI